MRVLCFNTFSILYHTHAVYVLINAHVRKTNFSRGVLLKYCLKPICNRLPSTDSGKPSMSRGGRMVIVPAFHMGGLGSIPGKVEMLDSVSVKHDLTGPRYKNGASRCWEGLMYPPLWNFVKAAFVLNHLRVMAHTKVG